MGLLHKSVPHESLTLPFEPFRFWLLIRGDIRNRKTSPRISPRIQSQNGNGSKCSVQYSKGPMPNLFMQKPRKIGLIAMPL
jgi:hypothetical protein